MELEYLEENQNEAFDTDYHSPEAFAVKIDALKANFPNGPKTMLDLGGGAGKFSDHLLEAFPGMKATVFDVSDMLLSRNVKSPRKLLVKGSVQNLATAFGGKKFDVIAINWLLHHLVGKSLHSCKANCVETLTLCKRLLNPGGVIIIAENAFEGPFRANIPSGVIFNITRVRNKHFVRLSKRFFNTAGVGVCFRSSRAWDALFKEVGLSSETVLYKPWYFYRSTRLKLAFLGIASVAHQHAVLRPAN